MTRWKISFFVFVFFIFFTSSVSATNIYADHLEYIKQEDIYILTGNVKIEKEDSILTADKLIFNNKTSDAEATGNVRYEDNKSIVITEKAEINMDYKTGKLYNALIFFKEENYWINGNNILKITENHYYAKEATFTTCNPDNLQYSSLEKTDWCFKGQDVDIVVGEKLKAKNVTYRVKGLPVLYSPYIWAPVQTKRQTGFLIPTIGTSSKKGFQLSPSFFWAIDENKDATFSIDIFTKRGIGKGLEYRYIDLNGRGDFYLYYIRDRELKKDFFQIKAFNEYKDENIKSFLDINYINPDDFFREYSTEKDIRITRFLQSSAEVSLPFKSSRLYALGQYWIDLKAEDDEIPQRLPEIGYVVNPRILGPILFSMNTTLTNFYRERDEKGQRLDINPTFSHLIGDSLRLFQSLSLRGTFYNFKNDEQTNYIREIFKYSVTLTTRLFKKYDSFVHILEPYLSYSFTPKTKRPPLFDSIELLNNQSIAEFSLYNQLIFDKLNMYMRLTQPYNLNPENSSDSLMPTSLEISVFGMPFQIKTDVTYDLKRNNLENINSQLDINVSKKLNINIGERYDRAMDIFFLKGGMDGLLTNKLSFSTSLTYDAKGKGLRDSNLKLRYSEQCWATTLIVTRRPGDKDRPVDYSFVLLIELKGIGTFKAL
jgi:LPS-assembly protein